MMMTRAGSWFLLLTIGLLVGLGSSLTPSRSLSLQPSQQQQQRQGKSVLLVARNEFQETIRIAFDDDDDDDSNSKTGEATTSQQRRRARWHQLDPKYKQQLIAQGQQRAIANKKKREPATDQKRKLLLLVQQQQREKKRAARIRRLVLPHERKPLTDFAVGSEHVGLVISLTQFGAYIDIGAQECDGLLHISQLSSTVFVEHPRQVLTPGQEIVVTIRSSNPEHKKLHLTMLPKDILEQQLLKEKEALEEEQDDRIPLDQIQINDELWGEIQRVTNFGAYVEVGAVVDGWLHFMDHPSWDNGAHPSEFMTRGDRIRVWVANVDKNQNRLKLTAHRPQNLPGPRREFR